MTSVLITGASGLVGGRLLQHLQQRGDLRIRAASRRARSWPEGIAGCVTDIERSATLDAACDGIDTVINLASMGEAACTADPAAALKVNVGGTLALAGAATRAKVRRFVQLSTFKVYGAALADVIDETSVCRPRSHYAITHRAAEDYVQATVGGSVVLRLSNGFGVPTPEAEGAWDVIVNEFCRQAVTDRRITIRSSGQAWRNFVPLDDVCSALVLAMTIPAGIYNLGSSESMPLRDAARRVAETCDAALGFRPEVQTGPPDAVPPPRLAYSIDKLRSAGFTPGTAFETEAAAVLVAAQQRFADRQ